jgi:TonB family protein
VRTFLVAILACLPLLQAQDSRLLKSVEPRYETFSPELTMDFVASNASVTLTVLANGKPLSLDRSSLPLPLAVVMALQDYEFQPQGATQHGRPETEAPTHQVTLEVPVRRSKNPSQPALHVNPGVSKGLLVRQVRPEYSEYARHNRIQGTVTLDAHVTEQGTVGSLEVRSGPLALIEAAYSAVQQWQYRPYLLNREPVEWASEIQIAFN